MLLIRKSTTTINIYWVNENPSRRRLKVAEKLSNLFVILISTPTAPARQKKRINSRQLKWIMVRRDCIISVRSMHIELIEKFFAQIKKVFPLQIDSKRDEALSYYYWNHVQFDAKSIAQIGPRRIPRSTYLHPMSLSPEAVTTWGHARHDVLAAPSHVQSALFLFNQLTWQSTAKQVVGKQTNGMFHILLFFFSGESGSLSMTSASISGWTKVDPPPAVYQHRTRWKIENHL